MDPLSFKYLAVGLLSLGFLGAAIGVGQIFAAMLNGIARNPASEPKLSKYIWVGAGMVEALGLFAFLVMMILLFVI